MCEMCITGFWTTETKYRTNYPQQNRLKIRAKKIDNLLKIIFLITYTIFPAALLAVNVFTYSKY